MFVLTNKCSLNPLNLLLLIFLLSILTCQQMLVLCFRGGGGNSIVNRDPKYLTILIYLYSISIYNQSQIILRTKNNNICFIFVKF